MRTLFVVLLVGLLLVGVSFAQEYKIPQLISEDYNCEEHPGFISDSKPAPFESSQHHINRHAKAVQNQIEEVCN